MLGYPEDGLDVLGPRRYRLATREAVKAFRRSRPWQGNHEERAAKFQTVFTDLCRIYHVTCVLEIEPDAMTRSNSFNSSCCCGVVNLTKFSVVTLFHEFAHAMGKDEWQACDWSLNLFRIMFPNSFSRCRFDGHCIMSVRPALNRAAKPAANQAVAAVGSAVAKSANAEGLPWDPSTEDELIALEGQALVNMQLATPAQASTEGSASEASPVQAPSDECFVGDEMELAITCLKYLSNTLEGVQYESHENTKKAAQVRKKAMALVEMMSSLPPLPPRKR